MRKIGYRTEQMHGEGYRDAAEVMNHEVFNLQNTDILDTLSSTILKNTVYEEKLKHLSDVIEEKVEDDEINALCDDIFEDEAIGIAYFKEIINEINSITGRQIKYVLWLCDSIDDVKKEYDTLPNDQFTSFDLYEKSDIILSDLGKGGKLYGYEHNPIPYSHKEISK